MARGCPVRRFLTGRPAPDLLIDRVADSFLYVIASAHPASGRAMRRLAAVGWITILALPGLDGCSRTMRPPPPPTAAESLYASITLQGVLDDHFRYIQYSQPELATWAGGWVPKLPDPTLDQLKRDGAFARGALGVVEAIDVDALTEDQYVAWLSFRWDMDALSAQAAFYYTTFRDAVPGQSGLDQVLTVLRSQRITSQADVDRYATILRGVAPMVTRIHAGLVERADREIRLPALVVPRSAMFFRSFIAPGARSPFALPPVDSTADGLMIGPLRSLSAGIIDSAINPVLDSLARYLEGPYAAEAPQALGLSQYPGGRVHYEESLRRESTVDISPEDAHAFGVREVSRLALLAARAAADAGLPAGRDSLRAMLRDAPRFAIPMDDSAGALRLQGTTARLLEDATRRLDSLFSPSAMPPLSIGLMDHEATLMGGLTEYVPPSVPDPIGHFRLNLERFRRRGLLDAQGMVFEELMPGMHLQQARQRADGALPSSRRVAWHGGYVRGWQLYSMLVADSIADLRGTASHFGVLLRAVADACGLVVDTGINALGWTREQALAFLGSYLPYDAADLERDFIIPAVEQPGALAAATLGARELLGLRLWAERELGDRFSLAAFHHEVLRLGSMPLPVLGSHLERWIWDQTHPPTPAPPPPGR